MTNKKLFYLFVFLLPFLHSCEKDEGIPETKNEPFDKSITAIAIQENNVWVGTEVNGLYKFDGESWTVFTVDDGLVNDSIKALTVSNDGSLWVGTISGLSKFKNQNWSNYTVSDGMYYDNVRCIAADNQNNIWIGTYRNRLLKYDGISFSDYHIVIPNTQVDSTSNLGHIHSVACDFEGKIWVGSCLTYLSSFDGASWDHHSEYNTYGFPICIIGEDLWAGTRGLVKISNGVLTNYDVEDGLVNEYINCLSSDQHNNIWIGTSGGLSKFDGSVWTNYTMDNGLLENNIKALACDKNDNVWVGHPNGLTKLVIKK